MLAPDMKSILEALQGRTLSTVDHGLPNWVVSVSERSVWIGTSQSPEGGTRYPISRVQAIVDRIYEADGGEVEFDPRDRSAFLAAVVDTLDGVEVMTGPRRARLVHQAGGHLWNKAENSAAVDAYLLMLSKERAGEAYNKAQMNRDLRGGPLSNRSAGAVEFRMQNISFDLDRLGLPWIRGYKPMKGTSNEVGEILEERLSQEGLRVLEDLRPTSDRDLLESRARSLSLMAIVPVVVTHEPPKSIQAKASQFVRNPNVVAWVRRAADGVCELCGLNAPFRSKDEPFLEVHHVVPLSESGWDSIDNAVAVCPNCHRRCHHSDDRAEVLVELPRFGRHFSSGFLNRSRGWFG